MSQPLKYLTAASIRYERWRSEQTRRTRGQRAFQHSEEPFAVWRDANQVGKSTELAMDAIDFCRGTHPRQGRHTPPVKILIGSESWEQFVPLHEKLWALAPKHELDSRCGFVPGRGLVGKPPRLLFSSGPGQGSLIIFATYKQGASRVAGSTLSKVYLDEPAPEAFLGEIVPRVLKNRGFIRQYFTPTSTSHPVGWLKDKVDRGDVAEYNFGLDERACWPAGNPSPWLNQAEIDQFEKSLLAHEVDMRMGRSWFARLDKAWLKGFTDANVKRVDLDDLVGWTLGVGVDHGTAEGKMASVLVACDVSDRSRPRVRVLAEAVFEGLTLPEDDARSILDMLRSVGLTYDDIDEWVGDVPATSKKSKVRKSNRALRKELATQLGRSVSSMRRIYRPQKYPGSVADGMRTLNAVFTRTEDDGTPHALVAPRCTEFIQGCKTFDGHPKHVYKDPLDAGRYPIERICGKQTLKVVAHY
jgi:phage terminase large subunit-like protein